MNSRIFLPVVAGMLGTGAVAGSVAIANKAKKTLGAPGSMGHIMTNDKLDRKAKKEVLIEQNVESAKDMLKLAGASVGAAATTSLVVGNSKNVTNVAKNLKNTFAKHIEKFSFNGKNLKEIIKSTGLFKKFNTLSTPAKAGILAGAAVLALGFPLLILISAAKSAYIEAQHESK